MKKKSINLNEILAKEFKDGEFRFLFDQHQFYLQIAHLISDLRTRNGLTQAELAKKSFVSQPMVARLEKGDISRAPTFETVFKVLKALGYNLMIHAKKDKRKFAA